MDKGGDFIESFEWYQKSNFIKANKESSLWGDSQ